MGRFAAAVFADRVRFAGQTVPLASDRLTGPDLAVALTQASGRPIISLAVENDGSSASRIGHLVDLFLHGISAKDCAVAN